MEPGAKCVDMLLMVYFHWNEETRRCEFPSSHQYLQNVLQYFVFLRISVRSSLRQSLDTDLEHILEVFGHQFGVW